MIQSNPTFKGASVQVLVAHSDGSTRERFSAALQESGFTVAQSTDSLDVMRKVFLLRPVAIVVDLRLPGMDGLEMVRVLRAATDVPILTLAGSRNQYAAARVLDCGADDYLDGPVNLNEFVARLRAAVRRHQQEVESSDEGRVARTGDLVIDRESETVTRRGLLVRLTRTEYRLLSALASRIGRVSPHRFLLSTVWGEEYIGDVHYLRVYMGYLRLKLEDDPAHPRYILNEWGTGYRLAVLPPNADVVSHDSEVGAMAVAVA